MKSNLKQQANAVNEFRQIFKQRTFLLGKFMASIKLRGSTERMSVSIGKGPFNNEIKC